MGKSKIKLIAAYLLGIFILFAGIGHLTWQRQEFQAQVPSWIPLNKDFVVLASGFVEICFGLLLIFWRQKRAEIGIALAIFFILVFPGNVSQYLEGKTAFGLDTDTKRFARLFFQPLLIYWALWSCGSITFLQKRKVR